MATEYPDIHETPGVCGGYPRIGDTRIPVRVIVEHARAGVDVAGILAMYPDLTREQVEDALAYYAQHPERVDEDIATNARALADLRKPNHSARWSA
ncbi:MAG TPA: DUF433 domain-containing protein [Thermomicrobiales bacterium]|nr:DUF433 domain-containing protein [Thermomicrobiales bacterium]